MSQHLLTSDTPGRDLETVVIWSTVNRKTNSGLVLVRGPSGRMHVVVHRLPQPHMHRAQVLAGIPGSPAAIYHFLMDAAGRAIMSCPVTSQV